MSGFTGSWSLGALRKTYGEVLVGSDDGEDLSIGVGDGIEDGVGARHIWCLTCCRNCDIELG